MTGRWTDGVRREVLSNGLTVLVLPDPDSPAVAVATLVRAGFFDEPDDLAGVSHVLEHMFFKGTARRGPGEMARETKAAGGWLNAGTGYDHTSYYTVLPAASLAVALDLQADALRHAAIDAGELHRELRVIVEEARRKRDTPGAVAHETMHAVLFDHHRIRRWRIGEEPRLATFTRDEVVGYYRSRYVPSRVIVAIAGGVAVETAVALVRERFADWTATPETIAPGPEEPRCRELRARTLRGDVTQANLVLGWRTVPPLDPDAPALEMAAAILSAGRSSWLQRALREPGIVLSVAAAQFAPTEVGVFSVSADLAPDRLREAIRGTARTLERLAGRGPSPDDVALARTVLRARLARRMESAEARASLLAEAEAVRDVAWVDEWAERIEALTPAEVREAAERWLGPDAVAGVGYLPEGSGEELNVELLREAFQPPRVNRPIRRDGGTRVLALPGLDLLIRAKPGPPLVTAGLFRARGAWEPPDQCGVGTLAVRSAVRGAGGLDAAALALAFERLGGPVTSSLSADHFGFATTVLAEHLVEAADLLRRVMWQPAFADATVRVERDTLARDAARLADDMFRYPLQLAFGAAFGDQGYGQPTGGTPETVAALNTTAVADWHRGELAAGRSVMVVVGALDPDRAADELAERLEAIPAAAGRPRDALPPPPAGDAVRIVSRDRAQTALALVFPGPSRLDPRRFAAEIWAAVAGGLGGRLFEALRDRRSLAYTVLASAWQRRDAGALITYIATSPDREEEAREQMVAELARFRRDGVDREELQRAAAYLAGQTAVGRQTGAAIASELVDLWLAGEPLERFEEPAAPYRAVTLEMVHQMLVESLDPARRAEGVVRGGGRR